MKMWFAHLCSGSNVLFSGLCGEAGVVGQSLWGARGRAGSRRCSVSVPGLPSAHPGPGSAGFGKGAPEGGHKLLPWESLSHHD